MAGRSRDVPRGTLDAFARRGAGRKCPIAAGAAGHADGGPAAGRKLGAWRMPGLRAASAQALPRKRDRLCKRRLSGDGPASLIGVKLARRRRLVEEPPRAARDLPSRKGPTLTKFPTFRRRTLEAIASDGWVRALLTTAEGGAPKELVRYSDANDGFFHHGRSFGAGRALGASPLRGTYRDVTIYETAGTDPGFRPCSRC